MQKAKEKPKEINKRGGEKEIRSKRQKGITLIALVITIIVLLILAAVSIATLTGENGILTKANDAKDKTQIEDVKEQARLDILAEKMENGGGNLSDTKLKEILDKYFENVPETDELEGKLKDVNGFKLNSKPEYGGQEVDIGEIYDGDLVKEPKPVTVEEVEKSLADNKKIQYVTNYEIDTDGDGNATDDWEIFYIEDYSKGENNPLEGNQPTKGKRIFLIASDYAKVRKEESDKSSTPIKNSIEKAHMTGSTASGQEDYCLRWSSPEYHCTLPNESENPSGEKKPACTFPKLFEFSQFNIELNAGVRSYQNSISASSLLCTGNWIDFVNTNWADYATGGPSVEMWVNSWNKRYPENTVSFSALQYGYSIGKNTSGNGTKDLLYFPHNTSSFNVDGDDVNESCWGYWLASPSSKDNRYVLTAHYSGLISNNMWVDDFNGVRPLVCLKTNVNLIKTSETSNTECFELIN